MDGENTVDYDWEMRSDITANMTELRTDIAVSLMFTMKSAAVTGFVFGLGFFVCLFLLVGFFCDSHRACNLFDN